MLWQLNMDGNATSRVAILEGHSNLIRTIAFHPFLPILITGSDDKTIKFWQLNAESNSAQCFSTIEEQSEIASIIFHSVLPIMAAYFQNKTVKIWKINAAGNPTIFLTLPANNVNSITFHPKLPIITTKDSENAVKFWEIDDNFYGINCIEILDVDEGISIAFHPSLFILAMSNMVKTLKIWR